MSDIESLGWDETLLRDATQRTRVAAELLRRLSDRHHTVRRAAATKLGQIAAYVDDLELCRHAVLGLLEALRDENSDVRRSAGWALGWIGHPRAVPGLLDALHDEDGDVRWIAAWSLGRIKHRRAVPGLLDALRDEDAGVRRAAARALEAIGVSPDKTAGQHLPTTGTTPRPPAHDHTRSRGFVVVGLLGIALATALSIALWAWNRPLGPQLVQPEIPSAAADLDPDSTDQPIVDPTPTPKSPPQCGGPATMMLLLVGSDAAQGNYAEGFADVIRIVRVDFVAQTATLLAIPRDLWVVIPGLERHGIIENRVKTAYTYGFEYDVPGGGPSLLAQTLHKNFDLTVDHYAVVNFTAFEAGIDAIGGIDIDVPEPMGDPSSGITFTAGRQHMDGKTALQYARIRGENSDLYRLDHQTQVMLAVREKVLSPQILPTLPKLVESMRGMTLTDLSPAEISMLVCIGQRIEPDGIQVVEINEGMFTMTVDAWGHEVLLPDYEAIARLVQAFNAGGF